MKLEYLITILTLKRYTTMQMYFCQSAMTCDRPELYEEKIHPHLMSYQQSMVSWQVLQNIQIRLFKVGICI